MIPLKKYGGGSYFPSGAPGREERREEDFPQGENRKEKVPTRWNRWRAWKLWSCSKCCFRALALPPSSMLTKERLSTFRSDRGQSGRLGPLRQGGAHWTGHLKFKVTIFFPNMAEVWVVMIFCVLVQSRGGERGGPDHWGELPHPGSESPGSVLRIGLLEWSAPISIVVTSIPPLPPLCKGAGV